MPRRIFVAGASGSGKTTYATYLSGKLKIPVFHLDEIDHDDRGNRRRLRPEGERADIIKNILNNNRDWIIEGSSCDDWVNSIINTATEVQIMTTPKLMRCLRLVTRYVKVRLRKEHGYYKPTLRIIAKLLRKTMAYDATILPVLTSKIPAGTRVIGIRYYK